MSKRPSTANRDPSATESGDDELFLSRWARRKRAARVTADVDTELAESSPQGEKLAESAPVSADPAPGWVRRHRLGRPRQLLPAIR